VLLREAPRSHPLLLQPAGWPGRQMAERGPARASMVPGRAHEGNRPGGAQRSASSATTTVVDVNGTPVENSDGPGTLSDTAAGTMLVNAAGNEVTSVTENATNGVATFTLQAGTVAGVTDTLTPTHLAQGVRGGADRGCRCLVSGVCPCLRRFGCGSSCPPCLRAWWARDSCIAPRPRGVLRT